MESKNVPYRRNHVRHEKVAPNCCENASQESCTGNKKREKELSGRAKERHNKWKMGGRKKLTCQQLQGRREAASTCCEGKKLGTRSRRA